MVRKTSNGFLNFCGMGIEVVSPRTQSVGERGMFCQCSILCQNSIPEVEFYSGVCQFSLLCQNSIPVFVKGMLFR